MKPTLGERHDVLSALNAPHAPPRGCPITTPPVHPTEAGHGVRSR